MLAKEVLEDSLLSFLTKDAPDVEVYGEPSSEKASCLLLLNKEKQLS